MAIINNAALELKTANRNSIFQTIFKEERITKQGLVESLGLSLPTITQNLNELQQQGLVRENGVFRYTGGRSAKGYSIDSDSRKAIGIDINKTHLSVVVLNLAGEIISSLHEHRPFVKSDEYYRYVGEVTADTIRTFGITEQELLGIGISIQGLVNSDKTQVVYGPILGNTGETVQEIAKYIPYPCQLFHDADSAAFAELWASPHTDNAVYLSLSTNFGGSIIINRKILAGENYSAGKVEHMTLHPGGELCYCGKRGCVEAYCNTSKLTEGVSDGKLDLFFQKLERGDQRAQAQWDSYLDNLSLLISSLHMLLDCEVILGGYMAPYLDKYLEGIIQRVRERNRAGLPDNLITLASSRTEAIAVGAALYYVDRFIQSV